MESWRKKIDNFKKYPEGSNEKREYDSVEMTRKQFAIKYYENYPEGSGGRKVYDFYTLPFQSYLDKYYSNYDSTNWNNFFNKFVYPLFDKEKLEEYYSFLKEIQPPFFPDHSKINVFFSEDYRDEHFEHELKYFFAFLYSTGFFANYKTTFSEWVCISNWQNPLEDPLKSDVKPIKEIVSYEFGVIYLKSLMLNLQWLN